MIVVIIYLVASIYFDVTSFSELTPFNFGCFRIFTYLQFEKRIRLKMLKQRAIASHCITVLSKHLDWNPKKENGNC